MNYRIPTIVSASNEEHNFFISGVSKDIKDVQHLAAATLSGVCVNNSDWQLQKLSERLDHLFLHGLKNYIKGYFEAFREFTHQSICDEILHSKNITTDIGRSRAWLLHALRDHLIGSYLQCMLEKSRHFAKFYDRRSIFFDGQKLELLITLISGLENIEFSLCLDVDYLDLSCCDGIPINFTPNVTSESQNLRSTNYSMNGGNVSPMRGASTSDHSLSAVENIPHYDAIIVEHLPRKKKKNMKNKDRDDSSISSDSSSIMTTMTDLVDKILTSTLVNGDVVCSSSSHNNSSYFKPFKKSEESSHFDELFEQIVFGKTTCRSEKIEEMIETSSCELSRQNSMHDCDDACDHAKDRQIDPRHDDDENSINHENVEEFKQMSSSLEEEDIKEELLGVEIPSTSGGGGDDDDGCEVDDDDDDDCSDVEVLSKLVIRDVVDGNKQLDLNECVGEDLNYENQQLQSQQDSSQFPLEPKVEDVSQEVTENPLQFQISNNLKLLLLLDVFRSDEEQLVKAFQTFQNFMEGRPTPLLVVISSLCVYFLAPFDKKLILHGHITYKDLSCLSVGLDEQSLDFVAKNKARYSVSTCNPLLTRTLVDEVSRAVGDVLIDVLTLRDATNQKISIKRWIGNLLRDTKVNGAAIKGFFLVSYLLNIPVLKGSGKIIRKGHLDVLTHVRHMHGIEPMWRGGYFVLRKESLHEFRDESLSAEVSTFKLSEWHECRKCNKYQFEKKHCFSVIPLSHHESNRTISFSEQKTKSPFVQLFQTVSSQLLSLTSADHSNVLPILTFSAMSNVNANEWIADLKSVIKNSLRRGGSQKLKHGCCILVEDGIHLCSMNSLSCAIHSNASLPLNELRCMTLSKHLIKSTFNIRDDLYSDDYDDQNLNTIDVGMNSDMLDFELVEFEDEMIDPKIKNVPEQPSLSNKIETYQKSTKNDVSMLDLFFQSPDDRNRFSSNINSLFSKLTKTEIQMSHNGNDDMPPELDRLYNFYDWNSLDSVATNIP